MIERPEGTRVVGYVGQPMGDIGILATAIGLLVAWLEGNLLFVAVIPPSMALLLFLNWVGRHARMEADARELVHCVRVALNGESPRR